MTSQRRPANSNTNDDHRHSNVLRASVLDAALLLGIGTSRTVENWMFDSVEEGDEEECLCASLDQAVSIVHVLVPRYLYITVVQRLLHIVQNIISPGLTSASTATSEESSLSPFILPPNGTRENDLIVSKPSEPTFLHVVDDTEQHSLIHFADKPTSSTSQPPKHNKLRKLRRDGYESDAGYMSDAGKEKNKEKKRNKKKDKAGADTDYETDSGHVSTKDRSKTFRKATKPSLPDGGDVPDAGFLSEASLKKKRSFFRLNTKLPKKSRSKDLSTPVPSIPAVPPLPALSLPIADMFSVSSASSTLDEDSRSVTPIPGLPRDFGGSASSVAETVSTSESIRSLPPNSSKETISHSQSSMESTRGREHRVRFTASTQFAKAGDWENNNSPLRPKISLPITSSLSPLSSGTSSPQPFLARSMGSRRVPSPLMLPKSESPMRATPSPISSDYYIVPSSEFIVPSPSPMRRSPMPSPRGHFAHYDLPPPSPPPQGPLPQVPAEPAISHIHAPPTAFGWGGHIPSRAPSPSPSLLAQPIQRGRAAPFPSRPILPRDESTQLIRRTSLSQRARMMARRSFAEDDSDIGTDAEGRGQRGVQFLLPDAEIRRANSELSFHGPSTFVPPQITVEDEEVRPDVAQFFFGNQGAGGPTAHSIADDGHSGYFDDDKSVYPDDARTLGTLGNGSTVTIDSYYFNSSNKSVRESVWSKRASFLDDERSGQMREMFVKRVEEMYSTGGPEKDGIPPVPKLPF
ncbi:hypothetical protein EW146_g4539 [Bondarzewia mesenterica]|uniref:Uncharacterized protein n=1 Tax=Bondarzewia mesenterica TaxID=1095465 RepID=A0A4V3XF42_9AGAM|nr:hypothetical protein EW146_g4539 [Bondarzewia mesenterica]